MPLRSALPLPVPATLSIRAWPDPVIDQVGHDPRSAYVERFWLGILGPSTTWLLRRVAAGLEATPDGLDLDVEVVARALGLGGTGRHSPFQRALSRCVQFDLARPEGPGVLAVRRRLPPLTRRQVLHLPEALQAEHLRWQEGELHVPEATRLERRARRLALGLVELGEDEETAERELLRWRYPTGVARAAARWAAEHRRGLDDADAPATPAPLPPACDAPPLDAA